MTCSFPRKVSPSVPPSAVQKLSLETRLQRYQQHATKLLPYLHARGLGAGAVDRFRLGFVTDDEEDWRLRGRMVIPYLTPTGVVQLRFRCLDPHHEAGDPGKCPKYWGEAGTEVTLFNAHATLDARGPVFITEGEMDAIAITTLTGHAAVGVPGAKSWVKHPYWARCFVGLDLILPADGDDAGNELAKTIATDLPEVRIVRLPDHDDANSVLARDPDEFLERCGLVH